LLFTTKGVGVVRNRGNMDDEDVQAFLDAGFTKRQILEVILGISQKVMSNYTSHFASTPVDAPFTQFDWQKVA
jgi:alkylhydroperoxidase family enzyme